MKCPYCRSKKLSDTQHNPPEKPKNLSWTLIILLSILYGTYFNLLVVPFMVICVFILMKPSLKEYHKELTKWQNSFHCDNCNQSFYLIGNEAYKYQ